MSLRPRIYLAYKTPSAVLHAVTLAGSKAHYWIGFSVGDVFVGLMWRRPRVTPPPETK